MKIICVWQADVPRPRHPRGDGWVTGIVDDEPGKCVLLSTGEHPTKEAALEDAEATARRIGAVFPDGTTAVFEATPEEIRNFDQTAKGLAESMSAEKRRAFGRWLLDLLESAEE